MKFITAMSGFAVTGSLLLGFPGVPPAATAAPTSVGIAQNAPFAEDFKNFPKGPQDERLSDEEREILKKPPNTLSDREKKIYNRAKNKEIKNQKYQGDRNKQKRENNKRIAPKGAKTIRPPKPGWGGGGGRF